MVLECGVQQEDKEAVQKLLSENRYLAVAFSGMPQVERGSLLQQLCQHEQARVERIFKELNERLVAISEEAGGRIG